MPGDRRLSPISVISRIIPVRSERVALEAWDQVQAGALADGRAASRLPGPRRGCQIAESPG